MLKRVWPVLVVALGFSACATEDAAPPVEGEKSFEVVTHTPTEIEVLFRDGGELRARAVEEGAGVVSVTFDFGQTTITYKLDYSRGIGDFVPSGQPLDASHTRLIEGLFAQLAESTAIAEQSTRTRVEEALFRQANLMTIVPIGESLQAYTFRAEQGWSHISCSCSNQWIGGAWRQAGKGCGCKQTGGGGNGCTGRCGQGCGGTSTPPCWGTTAYTQDCAKHDYGIGSWWAASDDYSFASNNCSCSGTNCY